MRHFFKKKVRDSYSSEVTLKLGRHIHQQNSRRAWGMAAMLRQQARKRCQRAKLVFILLLGCRLIREYP